MSSDIRGAVRLERGPPGLSRASGPSQGGPLPRASPFTHMPPRRVSAKLWTACDVQASGSPHLELLGGNTVWTTTFPPPSTSGRTCTRCSGQSPPPRLAGAVHGAGAWEGGLRGHLWPEACLPGRWIRAQHLAPCSRPCEGGSWPQPPGLLNQASTPVDSLPPPGSLP